MRQGRSFDIEQSNVVQRQISRSGNGASSGFSRPGLHRTLMVTAFLIISLIGSPGIASAGPLLIPMEDSGGGGGAVPPALRNQYTAVRLFDEVFSQQKPDVCNLLMAANAINHTPTGTFAGPAGFERFVAEVRSAFSDATFVIDDGFADGDVLTLRWTMQGHHLGDFQKQAATGVPVYLEGLAILRFEQDMIAESWIQYDRMSLVEQIKAIPAGPRICPPCQTP